MKHALRVSSLPDFHRDPFDRMIVAQAQVEDLPVLTADPQLAGYSVKIIW
jgi:PIN domain nuclease of toxin-antitoxin system